PCIMEFRRYEDGDWRPKVASSTVTKGENPEDGSNCIKKAIYLPLDLCYSYPVKDDMHGIITFHTTRFNV
ncbi:alkylated DNA repair protein alkB-like protein, partial [Trifolium medium]|nr:alkylated DNA repair protein alkB-like protein [Trifolium medium]